MENYCVVSATDRHAINIEPNLALPCGAKPCNDLNLEHKTCPHCGKRRAYEAAANSGGVLIHDITNVLNSYNIHGILCH